MALAFVFLSGMNLLSDVGTRHSVIRSRRGEDPSFLRSAWTIQVIRGLGIGAMTCLLSWPISRLYDQPDLFPVLCVLSLSAVMKGLTSISMATTSRNMQYARQTLVLLGSQVVTISVMIFCAWWLENVWALVIGGVLGATLSAALSHVVLPPFRHRLELEREAVRELISYGRWILLSTGFTFLGGRGITAIYGLLVPVDVLGVLTVSTTLIRTLEDLVGKLLNNVGFPALSKTLREEPERLTSVLRRIRHTLMLGATAIFVLLAFAAQPLIDFLYDDRYAMAGQFLAIQALNGAARVFSMPYQNVLLAVGDSRTHAVVMFGSAAIGILSTVAGFFLLGAYGMILGMGAAALIVFAVSAAFAHWRGYADLHTDFLLAAGLMSLYWVVLDRLLA